MNLLVLSPWFPYPPDNGSRLRAFHLIRELAAQGHRIRLVTGLQDDAAQTLAEMGEAGRIPRELRDLCDNGNVTAIPWRWPASDSGSGGGIGEMARALLSPIPRSIRESENPALIAAIREQMKLPTDAALGMELGIHPYVPFPSSGRTWRSHVQRLPFPVALDQVEVSGMARAVRDAPNAKARLRHALTRHKGERYWHRELRRYDFLTAVSDEEAEAVRRVVGGDGDDAPPVFVIPNGVDSAAFAAVAETRAPVPGRIIYNGAVTYALNRDAVFWFAQEILPRIAERVPEAHLVVTGRYDDKSAARLRENGRVHLTGFLPDVRPALGQAAVCAVPLLAGGGTRLKILEAWAAGVPVVSTRIGAAGLRGENDVHLLHADTPETFAGAVTRLLQEPETAARIAQNARKLAQNEYDWRGIAARLGERLEAAAARQQE